MVSRSVKILERILGEETYRSYAQRWVEANRRAGCVPPSVPTEVFLFEQSKKLGALFPEAIVTDASELAELRSKLPKISLVTTLKGESSSLPDWIESLSKQTLPPSELVLVDAGKSPAINDVLKRRLDSALPGSRIVVLHRPGCNISEGRNLGVANSTGEIIAFTDLGCTLHPSWLERLTAPFAIAPQVELSAGWYESVARTAFASSFAAYTVPRLEDLSPPTFIASARSFALRRELFERVRGFPEYLTLAGEDSLFGYLAKFLTKRAAFVPDALVRWSSPHSALKAFRTTYNYAAGDAEGGRIAWRHYLDLVLAAPLFVFFVLRYPMRGTAPRYLQVFTVSILLNAQLLGFVRGYLRRHSVFLRRISRHKTISFLITERPITTPDEQLLAELTGLIGLDYFIVNVYSLAGAAEVKAEKIVEHQQLLSFPRIEFNPERFFTSIGDSVRNTARFVVIDRNGDGASRELVAVLGAYGVAEVAGDQV